MAMLFYDFFYRRFGIRKADQLLRPPLPSLELLELPKASILHFSTTSPLVAGPAADEYLFRNIARPIMMGHITQNGDTKGNPRRMNIAIDPQIRTYHIKNRRFKIMRSLESGVRDINTLVVYNYSFIPRVYHYMRSFYSEYYKWWNIQAAIWKNIAEIAQQTDRQQFILCSLPTVLPSLSDLRLGSNTVSQKTVKIFNSPESLMILELWKWFGENRKDSVLYCVHPSKMERVNLIFQESGRWFVLNLGMLNKWRVATKEELDLDPDANQKGIAPEQLQRRFLRLMMSLFQVRTVAAPEVADATAAEVTDKKGETVAKKDEVAPVVVKQEITIPEVSKLTGSVELKPTTTTMPVDATTPDVTDDPNDTGDDITHDEELDKQLAADFAELETISKNHIGPHEDEVAPAMEVEINEAKTLEDGVMQVCDRLADNGLLSAAEYRRYNTLASSYRNIVSPNGTDTLDKFIEIKPEVLKIEDSPTIKDIPTVVDKTMLKSSLLAFDQRYIKEVMPRDVASMVLHVQNAGIAVTGYEVEKVEDVMGSYESHTVRVTPVEGASSTFHFKLPAIDDDGTYKANGVKYRMRKQRGDLPIRKIGPDRVALTSYYGKIFASRSSKRVNDYGQWLRNAIMARGLDDADKSITNLQPANVFDNLFPAPRLYSTLAMGFRGFSMAGFDLVFDHTKRVQSFGLEALSHYDKDGAMVVGHNVATEQYLVMDKNSALYVGNDKGELKDFGTFESVLGLEAEKAPVDFAELKVLGRTIPIGIVLGYEMGLDKLMHLLKVVPRRVPAGTRVNLEPHEYSIVFSDETLVFSRDDRLAAMILAGFNEYHRALRSYSVYDFDKRGVYLNVLESDGASTRYLREIDLLYQMFIDPITRDLLIEMKEPTNFRGLLLRSCDMLLTDQHPDELDPAFMRIKGYERMAGAVYSEIVRSVRAHSGRSGKSKLPIDLNPYAVWKTISQDPAIAMVVDINPIQNLKEMEAVTYSGVGGRNSRSMTKHTRVYHKNDMGTISESTVDSSDVAINTYTSADPQFTSLRGISKRYDEKTSGATALLSTSALISPGADRDD